MSRRYKGAIISATPPTTTGGSSGTAPGEWTLQQQMQAQGGSVWPSQPPPNYIEDVFSTYLYTGNDSTQTITNGIDLSTKGGLTWIKDRSAPINNVLFDTARGTSNGPLLSDTTDGGGTYSITLTSFNTDGFTVTKPASGILVAGTNRSPDTYVSWTWRKQPKYFDIQTWTGSGANRTISHSLGSVPGCIIVKRTDTTGDWQVYHQSLANTEYLVLNSTAAKATGATRWNSTTPTSSVFSLGTDATVNASGGTYVAYIFAHNAGGFGLTGADNVISCGSFTTDGSANFSVTLGYEPQWVLMKRTNGVSGWFLVDNMRGFTVAGQPDSWLLANSTATEASADLINVNATGFASTSSNLNASSDYIYIAIRRGPMKVPTVGTTVFSPVTQSANTSSVTTNFSVDLSISAARNGADDTTVIDRLRGGVQITNSNWLYTNSTSNEGNATGTAGLGLDNNTGIVNNYWGSVYRANSGNIAYWSFKRAPTFFDEVCYTGTGANTTVAHNLAVVPELIIVKGRSGATAWQSYSSALANTEYLVLNTTAAKATGATRWNSTTPTSSVFSLGTASEVNTSAATYVAYLFATCAGVSKVGSYTGTGATQTIACGFTGGARFVLVKRTDSTGDWYVWDTARGMVAGTDPSLLLNSTAAEVNANSIYTTTGGFQIVSTAAGINASGGSYIFLAIA